jgi:hypothetical protein
MIHATHLSPGLQALASVPNIESINPLVLYNLEELSYTQCKEVKAPYPISHLRIEVRFAHGDKFYA